MKLTVFRVVVGLLSLEQVLHEYAVLGVRERLELRALLFVAQEALVMYAALGGRAIGADRSRDLLPVGSRRRRAAGALTLTLGGRIHERLQEPLQYTQYSTLKRMLQ